MQKRYNVFNRILHGIGASGSTVTIRDTTPQPGEYFIYRVISVEDVETANSDFIVGIRTVNGFHKVVEQLNIAAAVVETFSGDRIIVEYPNHLEVQIADSSDNDQLRVYLHGVVEYDLHE